MASFKCCVLLVLISYSVVNDFATATVQRKTMFRPLRRVVRNFIQTRRATVTLVFQHSEIKPHMRWFRQVTPNSLPNAEIPDMFRIDLRPTSLDSGYKLTTLTSHDVTAATLIIQSVDVKFPVKFVTCFAVNNETFQYQLDTVIDEPTTKKDDKLDGIVWVRAPSNISFSPRLTVSCAVEMESESTRYTDELNIYRNYLDRKRSSRGGGSGDPQLMVAGCGKIHKDRDDYVEDAGKYNYEGRRRILPDSNGHVLYEVSFKITNGSTDDIGVYTCAAERARDRTYISSWVHLVTPMKPVLIFLPCNDASTSGSNPGSQSFQVRLVTGTPMCVRCRVYDYRAPAIQLYKNQERIIASTETMLLDSHLNVADGGLNELTINFLNPTDQADAGRYECRIAGADTKSIEFDVSVIPQ